MRLIDLNTVIEEIEDTVTSVSFCGTVEAARSAHETKDRILSRVKDLPAIDAVPARHGRWEYILGDGKFRAILICSSCRRNVGEYNRFNYCPHCGAKMDLEGTDADKT